MGCHSNSTPLPVAQPSQEPQQVAVEPAPAREHVTRSPESDEPIIPTPKTLVAAGDYFASASTNPKLGEDQWMELHKKAEVSYKQAISLDKQHLPAYQGLARVQAARKQLPQAINTYREAVQIAPDNSVLWYELGVCQLRLQDWASAVGSITKAVELQPDNKKYIEALAITLARVGQPTESYLCFCRMNDEATAHYKTARVLKHIGQGELAREHLKMALQANPELDKARQLLAGMDQQPPAPPSPKHPVEGPGEIAPAIHTIPTPGPTSKYQAMPQTVVPVSQSVPARNAGEPAPPAAVRTGEPSHPPVAEQPVGPTTSIPAAPPGRSPVILPPPPVIPIQYEMP
jgi:tetratricopeptide (TPR) repeat protein